MNIYILILITHPNLAYVKDSRERERRPLKKKKKQLCRSTALITKTLHLQAD